MCSFCDQAAFQAGNYTANTNGPMEANGVGFSPTSTNSNINALISGAAWDSTAISWRIPTTAAQYDTNTGLAGIQYGDTARFNGWLAATPQMTSAVSTILTKMYSAVSGLTFTAAAASDTNADITIGRARVGDDFGTAYAYYPDGPGASRGGDIWFSTAYDNAGPAENFTTPRLGGYNWLTYIHELGHAMGLKHGHESDGPTGNALSYDRDSMEFSVMTYRGFIGADITKGYVNEEYGFAQSLMMYDIAALQTMYGANFNENSGNTVYSFSATTGEMFINGVSQGTPGANRIFRTLWDGNGVDTYDLSNYTTNLNIDLSPGGWSTFSAVQLANLGLGNYARANLFNALTFNGDIRSLIENAIGGAGDDVIVGNDIDNILSGGAGNDALYGKSGNDILIGGAGADFLTGGERPYEQDTASYRTALSNIYVRLDGVAGAFGDAVGDTFSRINGLEGSNFNDVLVGSAERNVILGSAGDDQIYGLAGYDELRGGDGNDRLVGGADGDLLEGGAGADFLDGGDDANTSIDRADYSSSQAAVYARLDGITGSSGDAAGDTFVSIEGLIGSAFDDVLVGNNNPTAYLFRFLENIGFFYEFNVSNTISGGAGNDSLYGLGGDDFLDGGIGNDTLYGGIGADYLYGREGFDLASYDGAASAVHVRLDGAAVSYGEGLGDTYSSIEGLVGSRFDDIIVGSNNADYLSGLGGDDYIYGLGGNDVLDGGAGEDHLLGGAGADSLDGGLDFDYADYSSAASMVYMRLDGIAGSFGEATGDTFISMEGIIGSAFNDILVGSSIIGLGSDGFPLSTSNSINGGAGNDQIYGLGGNDELFGGLGDDTIYGGEDADFVTGGAGSDNLYGGLGADYLDGDGTLIGVEGFGPDGFDLARYDQATSAVYVRLDGVAVSYGEGVGDTYTSIEGIVGSNYNDIIVGNDFENTLSGNAGNDELYGLSGNDRLDGGSGADALNGGNGIDIASYQFASTAIYARLDGVTGSYGDAVGDIYTFIEGFSGSSFNDTFVGDSLQNLISGNAGNDDLYGLAGNDTLDGGAGADTLNGGDGIDIASYQYALTAIYARLDGVAGSYGEAIGDIYTSIEGFSGSRFNDTFVGNNLQNSLSGNAGDDGLYGLGGSDTLDGGLGNDALFGGSGADQFVFNTAPNVATNADTIGDFQAGIDNIVLSQAVFAGIGATLDASEFQLGAADAATDRILYLSGTGELYYDVDGNGGAAIQLIATLTAGTALTLADFVMVA